MFADPEESPATKQLRRALTINPDDGVLLAMLALKLLCYQKHGEADGLAERALRAGPRDPQVIRYVAKFLHKQVGGAPEASTSVWKPAATPG